MHGRMHEREMPRRHLRVNPVVEQLVDGDLIPAIHRSADIPPRDPLHIGDRAPPISSFSCRSSSSLSASGAGLRNSSAEETSHIGHSFAEKSRASAAGTDCPRSGTRSSAANGETQNFRRMSGANSPRDGGPSSARDPRVPRTPAAPAADRVMIKSRQGCMIHMRGIRF